MYHGSPEERAELRRTKMVIPEADRAKWWLGPGTTVQPSKKSKGGKQRVIETETPRKNARKAVGRPPKGRSKKSEDEDENETGPLPPTDVDSDTSPRQKTTFPVVITTYEIVIKDRAELGMYRWGFIVVDEGHRLKNMDCRLIRELKALDSDSRMVLTGTPLHVSSAKHALSHVLTCGLEQPSRAMVLA